VGLNALWLTACLGREVLFLPIFRWTCDMGYLLFIKNYGEEKPMFSVFLIKKSEYFWQPSSELSFAHFIWVPLPRPVTDAVY
jgi:hypothetical protein